MPALGRLQPITIKVHSRQVFEPKQPLRREHILQRL